MIKGLIILVGLFLIGIINMNGQVVDTIEVSFTKSAYLIFKEKPTYDKGSENVSVREGGNKLIIQAEVEKITGKKIRITILEQKNPDTNSKLLGEWIAAQLEKRIPFRRAMKMGVQKALKAGAEGVKIGCAGRLGGVEIARSEWYREGRVPLHTLRANIDYAFSEALTTYGKIGVKVWVYHGEVLSKREKFSATVNDTVEQEVG